MSSESTTQISKIFFILIMILTLIHLNHLKQHTQSQITIFHLWKTVVVWINLNECTEERNLLIKLSLWADETFLCDFRGWIHWIRWIRLNVIQWWPNAHIIEIKGRIFFVEHCKQISNYPKYNWIPTYSFSLSLKHINVPRLTQVQCQDKRYLVESWLLNGHNATCFAFECSA